MRLPDLRFERDRAAHLPDPKPGQARVRRGFTLIEALVVIVLLGVLALVTLPRVGREIAHARVNRAAAAIAGELEQAQTMAARQRKPIRISFNSSIPEYTISDRASGTALQKRAFGPQSEFPVTTVSASPSTIDIFPSGLASSALEVTVAVPPYGRKITMSRAGHLRLGPQ